MKKPVRPPPADTIIEQVILEDLKLVLNILSEGTITDKKGQYLPWAQLRHKIPPGGLTSEQWWAATKYARQKAYREISVQAQHGGSFRYCLTNRLQEQLHHLDRDTAGRLSSGQQITNPHTRDTYLIRSLVEEAISSSQLEGASTTRNVARDMLRQDREPTDKSERMILNNYYAMQFIRENRHNDLTPAIIFELHRILTEGTLEQPEMAGKPRCNSDDMHVVNEIGKVLYTPPPAGTLQVRMTRLCSFANGATGRQFLHPVLRAVFLHFLLAYDHPFVDGNGRTARALQYWSLSRSGYWLLEFVSISTILKQMPVQYGMAFLHTETDDNDATYFLLQQVDGIVQGVSALYAYLDRKLEGIRAAEQLLATNRQIKKQLNFRQLAVVRHALKHPNYLYQIREHKNTHGVAYETARRDLLELARLGVLRQLKDGREYLFVAPANLEKKLRSTGG